MDPRGNPDPELLEGDGDDSPERAPVSPEARIAALLSDARAARADKDLPRAHAIYTEAAALGSTDADYALGVFALAGQVVGRDPRLGATHLRRAADAGHLQARVHLANVLDTGLVTGLPEPERAALFIRGVARSLSLSGTDTAADQRALAEAGVGRFVTAVEDATYEESQRWTKKARALGYGKRGPA
ncbi:MAG: sel1 repeat family protein, partial [Proteobacteria bacterium]